jgi:hypothetical protein
MNWTNRTQLVALVVATSMLSSVFTAFLIKRTQPSSADLLAAQNQMSPEQNRMSAPRNPMSITFGAPVDQAGLAKLEMEVSARQATDETTNAITIDLKPYVNAALTDSLADAPGEKDHTLRRLSAGVHTYGGVPFDVEGLVQLAGPSLPAGPKSWPTTVTNIAIGHVCRKLHLFHGAFNINGPGAHLAFAKLVLHYADGSNQELELLGGTHALKCTAPAVPPNLDLIHAPQTEMGWVGSDPYLENSDPGEVLHLYRTTLDNPKPDISITSLDYVSTMVNPAPFMAGLTLE